jgi:hypothetical protein
MKPNINSLGASHGSVMPGMPRCENRRDMLRRRFQDVLTRVTTQPAGLDPGGYEPNFSSQRDRHFSSALLRRHVLLHPHRHGHGAGKVTGSRMK